MSMDGEILQRIADLDKRLKAVEAKVGLLPEGSAAPGLRLEMPGDGLQPTPAYAIVCDPDGWYSLEIDR